MMNDSQGNNSNAPDGAEYRQRMAKLQRLRDAGMDPYGRAFDRTGTLGETRDSFEAGRKVSLAGRLVAIRKMGKSVFAHLQDGSGRFQIFVSTSDLEPGMFDAFKLLDTGDIIGVTGELFLTRTGEKTARALQWRPLSKALAPLPEKWHGLKDVETRYRRRHIDLIANPEARALFDRRSRMIRAIREFLWSRGFIEVETPMMQPQAGGANARPFQTHYAALDSPMYLRIAPELYLKRLLAGGYDKVFELNRNFRNEGLSKRHNPEFTMLEVYEAFSDCRGMMALARELIMAAAGQVVGGDRSLPAGLDRPWREIAYRDLVIERMGPEWFSLPAPEAARRAEALGLAIAPGWDLGRITHEIYEKTIERTLVEPTFVTRLPSALIPLAKRCPDEPECADVFELVICGMEIAPGYSELNDPLEQRARFAEQAGAEDAQKTDDDFLSALETGMPPAGGLGVGIDRLTMALSGADSIRDVILFPQLRQKAPETREP